MHVCFAQIKERVSTTLGDSLLAKAVSCAISVVKANCVQGEAATNRVRREVSISVATNDPFW